MEKALHVAQKEAKNIGRLLDDCVERADQFPAYIQPVVIAACFGKEYVAEIRSVTTEDTVQQIVFQPASGYSKVWLRG